MMKRTGVTRLMMRLGVTAAVWPCLVGLVVAQVDGLSDPDLVVDTAWLAAHLDDPGVRVVDVRRQGYDEAHVPGAVWYDLGGTRDADNPPTFLPDPAQFSEAMGALGISNDTHVVFYDDRGGVYGSRPWAVLNYFGHSRISIVNGGWLKWLAERRATTTDMPVVARATFRIGASTNWIASADDVLRGIDDQNVRIVDVRTDAEIDGSDLRGIARGGYVPSAVALYWEETLEGEFQTFKPIAELRELFADVGIGSARSIIAYCEGGGRSAHELFVLHWLGYEGLRLYLGSWQDWGNRRDLPLATVARDGKP